MAGDASIKRRRPLWWRVLTGALRGFFADNALSMAASLAFYTLVSFAPLLVLLVWGSTMVGYDARQMLLGQVARVAGSDARTVVATIYDSARRHPSLGSITGIAGGAMALVGATTVFAQLQKALNRIWGIRAQPGRAVLGWLRQRVLSLGVIGIAGLVLMASLVASAALGVMLPHQGVAWDALNQVVSAVIMAGLFAVLFQWLPDVRLPWRRVLWSGVITAALFALGNWVIGLYLSSGSAGSAYGAASSLAVLLLWVYYSGAIFFFGVEVLRAWTCERDGEVRLKPHAARLR